MSEGEKERERARDLKEGTEERRSKKTQKKI